MSNLRGRDKTKKEERYDVWKYEFNFVPTDEIGTFEPAEETEDVRTSGRRWVERRVAKCKGTIVRGSRC